MIVEDETIGNGGLVLAAHGDGRKTSPDASREERATETTKGTPPARNPLVDLRGQLSNPDPALVQLADQGIGVPSGGSPEPAARARLGTARRLKPDEVEALVAGYGAGKTMKDLAAEFGISRQTVSSHLRRASSPTRREGLDQEQTAEIVALYDAGWTSRVIADRYGVSPDTVLRTLRRQGVTIRSRHGASTPSRPLTSPPISASSLQ